MDKAKNILLAKKYMVESIYRSANVEGIGVTFPETQAICDGMSVSGHTVDDINAVNDLKKAWQWLFDNIDAEIGIDTLCSLNRIAGRFTVDNAGSVRDMYDTPIRVPLRDGNDYYPELPPSKEELDAQIKAITEEKSLDKALDLFCWICKKQIFNDGNKRTATLMANMFMIQNGLGVLSVPINKIVDFYDALTDFYSDETKKKELKKFLQKHCITGNEHNRTGRDDIS